MPEVGGQTRRQGGRGARAAALRAADPERRLHRGQLLEVEADLNAAQLRVVLLGADARQRVPPLLKRTRSSSARETKCCHHSPGAGRSDATGWATRRTPRSGRTCGIGRSPRSGDANNTISIGGTRGNERDASAYVRHARRRAGVGPGAAVAVHRQLRRHHEVVEVQVAEQRLVVRVQLGQRRALDQICLVHLEDVVVLFKNY